MRGPGGSRFLTCPLYGLLCRLSYRPHRARRWLVENDSSRRRAGRVPSTPIESRGVTEDGTRASLPSKIAGE
ncbi:hypothetical protein [Haloprofundus marisrubri]|uniref:hypothetical protein n=1 Tax=Haloprofundus marisrubri TaxID=1514971 RepID=UPI0012BA9CDA|nr:hypothetical protein [Haloprofundus marisrubri]